MQIISQKIPTIVYEPIGQRVLLSRPREDLNDMVMDKGVLVPGAQNRRNNPIIEHAVEAAGPDCKQVKVGDRVLFNCQNSGAQVVGENELAWTEEQFIVAIIRHAEPPSPAPMD